MSKTASRTGTQTATIAGGDVRRVISLTMREIKAICKALAQVARDFDADQAELDLGLFALYEVIIEVLLQFYIRGELVREHIYKIADQPLESWGPSPEEPPIGPVPDGTRVRLVVTPNPRVSPEERDHWFEKLNWHAVEALRQPAGASRQTYGTLVSGGYAVERQLLVNPKYDRPVSRPTDHVMARR